MLRAPIVLAAAAALALAGCGDDDGDDTGAATTGTGTATAAGSVSETIRVSETDFELNPENPRISEPGTVEFVATNNGQTTHALTVEGPGGEAETDPIAPGDTARLRVNLNQPGTYTWYCPIGNHRELGMVGRITVAGGGGGGDTQGEGERTEQGGQTTQRDLDGQSGGAAGPDGQDGGGSNGQNGGGSGGQSGGSGGQSGGSGY